MKIRLSKGKADDGGFIIEGGIHITRRELEVLSLVAAGLDNDDVAKRLNVTKQTVSNHMYNLKKKLKANSRMHTAIVAMQKGMLLIEAKPEGDKPSGKYEWCLHCERTYKYGKYRWEFVEPFVVDHVRYAPQYQMCPYEGCDGDAVLDAWDWNHIREYHPEYPEIPEYGVVYPMYGEIGDGKSET